MKRKFIQYLVKKLLKAVNEDDILRITNKGWLKGKRRLSDEEIEFLKEEAKALEESVLWKTMCDELRWLASLRMFEQSATEKNSEFGRAMLYNLEMQKKFIENCSKL